MTLGSGRQWAVLVPLLAGVVFAWPTYVRFAGVDDLLDPAWQVLALLVER